jgi:hypothetical protein
MLRANPTYRPDPIRVPPDEVAVFEAALREHRAGTPMASTGASGTPPATAAPAKPVAPSSAVILGTPPAAKPRGSRWWMWALGAAFVGGAVAVAAGSDGGEDPAPSSTTTLREPPPPPPP